MKFEMNYDEEIVCDLVANSHNAISEIAKEYWNGEIE